jgi:hypothetical protein
LIPTFSDINQNQRLIIISWTLVDSKLRRRKIS